MKKTGALPQPKSFDQYCFEEGDLVDFSMMEDIDWVWATVRDKLAGILGVGPEVVETYYQNRIGGGRGRIVRRLELPHGFHEGGTLQAGHQTQVGSEKDFHPGHFYLIKYTDKLIALYSENELSHIKKGYG